MAKWYYYNESGEKIEITGGQLKWLAKNGKITPETIVETEEGKTARAGKVKGLTFIAPSTPAQDTSLLPPNEVNVAPSDTEESYGLSSPPEPRTLTPSISEVVSTPTTTPPEVENPLVAASPPVAQPVPVPQATPPPPAANVFCTNCGNAVAEQAVACMSCGCKPIGHKKFCRQCGVGLNPEQVVCVKCGSGLSAPTAVKNVQDGIAKSVISIKQVAGNMFARTIASVKKPPIATSTVTTPLASPQANQATPQSAAAPVAESKGSYMVTLIGIMAILVVGGIGWAVISGSNTFTAAEQAEIDRFVAEYGDDVKRVRANGLTLLHAAAIGGYDVAVSRYLVSKGADVNAKCNDGSTPLYVAILAENADIIRFLVSKRADVNTKNKDGVTPLFEAITRKNVDIAKFLISKRADVNAKNNEGMSALHIAIMIMENIDIVKLLVSKGADVNAKYGEYTPIHAALALNQAVVDFVFSKFASELGAHTETAHFCTSRRCPIVYISSFCPSLC
jgi:hypothetical protein